MGEIRPSPPRLHLVFSSAATAERGLAGIPLAARVVGEVAVAAGGTAECVLIVAGGWDPAAPTRAEMARLAPRLHISIAADSEVGASAALYLSAELFVRGDAIAAALANPARLVRGISHSLDEALSLSHSHADPRRLDALGRALFAATGKASDGIVSRYLNRPISRAFTYRLLRIPGIRPMHATLGTALLGLAMAICLFVGGEAGVVAGALLFQAASIWDGVDGEMARATFRTSATGAMIDSLTDAATNIAFVAGLTTNLWLRGHDVAAAAGAAGLVMLTAGLSLIGTRARLQGGPFGFDAVKDHARARRSRVMDWLTFLTMRDFFAAACAVLVLTGFAPQALIIFAIVTAGWLLFTIAVLARPMPLPTGAHRARTRLPERAG